MLSASEREDFMIDRRSPMPLYVQLKNEILEKIKNGTYAVDAQIPTEKEFMEIYNLGRATVREAVAALVREGYLYKKHGIGTFVARKDPSLGFEPLISLTYSLKAIGISPNNIIENNEFIIPDSKLLKKLKWKKRKKCFYLRRIRYADDLPVAIEESYFHEETAELINKFNLKDSLAKIMIEDLNITISKIEQVIISRNPTEEEKEILKLKDNTLVLDMERWIYTSEQKEPYQHLKFVAPNNIYTYPLEFMKRL